VAPSPPDSYKMLEAEGTISITSGQWADDADSSGQMGGIVRRSRLFAKLVHTYGWRAEDQTVFVKGVTGAAAGASDWRVEKLLALDRQYGLNLTVDRDAVVLDAGSGTGGFAIGASGVNVNIVGVELDSYALELGEQLLAASAVSRSHRRPLFAQADILHLPFARDSFSVIMSHQVLEHTPYPQAMLGELHRGLRTDGLLWIDAPDYRFCCEPHYRIPWLPRMSKSLARHWLAVFRRPLAGLASFDYISLPDCVRMLETLKMDILHATTTVPLGQIDEDLQKLVGQTGDSRQWHTPEEVRRLAQRARRSSFRPEPVSFLILARKRGAPRSGENGSSQGAPPYSS